MQSTLKVTYRDIAKMLAKALPVQGQEFSQKVNDYLEAIKSMPQAHKVALKTAYIFSRKVPQDEREDLFQDIALAVFKASTKDERLAYTIARCDWLNWWKAYKIREHYSLDTVIEDSEGQQVSFGELLVGEVDFEARKNGDIDGERLYNKLPNWVKKLVDKRLLGYPIKGGDRQILNKWVASRPMILAEYQT